MKTKRCSKCKETKPLEEFYLQITSSNGRRSQCKQCSRERKRQYYAEHPDCRHQYRAEHRKKLREYAREYSKQYRADHPEKIAADARCRHARKAGAEGSFTAKQFIELCEQYGNRCLCCSETKKLTADHIVPLSMGGSNDISNIQPLCQPCNSRKHTQTIDYRNIK